MQKNIFTGGFYTIKENIIYMFCGYCKNFNTIPLSAVCTCKPKIGLQEHVALTLTLKDEIALENIRNIHLGNTVITPKLSEYLDSIGYINIPSNPEEQDPYIKMLTASNDPILFSQFLNIHAFSYLNKFNNYLQNKFVFIIDLNESKILISNFIEQQLQIKDKFEQLLSANRYKCCTSLTINARFKRVEC